MRSSVSVRVVNSVVALLLCVVMSTPAEAQLGRLKKAAEDLAKEKLGAKKDATAEATAAGDAAKSSASNTSVSFTITEDNIALVLASVEPSVAYAKRLQASNQASAEYATRQKASQECMEELQKSYNPSKALSMSAKTMDDIQRLTNRATQAQANAAAALERNDQRTFILAQDSATVLQAMSALVTLGGSCEPPFLPVEMADLQASAQTDAAQTNVKASEEAKSKLTHLQFGRIRERIALWAMLQENPTLKAGSEGVFTDEENAALLTRAADIKQLTPYFKDSSLRWSTWGDVTAW